MLGRRGLRVKVMQVLYGFELNKDTQMGNLKIQLDRNHGLTIPLYLSFIYLMKEVAQYAMVDVAIKLSKYIVTEEDKKASTTIAANRIVKHFTENEILSNLIRKEKIQNYITPEIVQTFYKKMTAKAKYKEYAALQNPTLEQDKEIIEYIFKKVFMSDTDLEQHLEGHFINYDDDQMLLLHVLVKFAKQYTDEGDSEVFTSHISQWNNEKKFADDMLRFYYQNDKELEEILQPNLQNWEIERMAVTDTVLLKMALCELLYFPTIPVKVTINEYIDLAKLYSTPRSKEFINGVLDKTKINLLAEGKIKKQGRGLVDN